ncbi:hypothetical protein C2G38_2180271 [Gigaspora rosea]|uniref:Uncharacterized protein n=1 Tax=Gigaspora rosea TaxID=44941 RepID=A0A397VE34_9GLOM|nr:hypothetical protein C2G38_2180271 [Gigaspora rosea]
MGNTFMFIFFQLLLYELNLQIPNIAPFQIIKQAIGSEEATTKFIVNKIEQASDRTM